MHPIKTLLTSAGMLLASAVTATAAPLAMLQDPTLKVEIHTGEAPAAQTVWYTNPVWLAIGGVVVLLVIVLAVLAARGRETTVVR